MRIYAVLGILTLVGCAGGNEMQQMETWQQPKLKAPFEVSDTSAWDLWTSGEPMRFEVLGTDPAEVWLEIRMMSHTKTRVMSPGDTWEPYIPLGVHELAVEIFGDCRLVVTESSEPINN